VLTDDYSYIDALPETVEVEVATPLAMLSEALRDQVDDALLLAAVRAVQRSAAHVIGECPVEMRELIEALPQ
jgi:hypothetical protein